MCTKLDLKKQVRLYMGAVIDFGNDVRFHVTKCYSPNYEEFGKKEASLEAQYI